MEEDEVKESQTNQGNDESNSLKRPRTERDPDYTEEESPVKAPQGAEVKPSRANSLKLFSIFSKPIISFNPKPIKFNSNPTDKEVKIPPKRKTAKAKKPKGTDTKTNKITNYFMGATAAADTNSNNTKAQSEEDDESDVAQRLDDK